MRRPIILTGLLREEEGKVLAKSLEIDGIDTFGNTIEEAKKNLIEAIGLYFESAKKLGIFSKVIKKAEQKQKEKLKPIEKLPQNYDYYIAIHEKLVISHA
jgi:predicted RNase H-like HicB family nuclease